MQKTTLLKFICVLSIAILFTKNSSAILTPIVDSVTMSDGKKLAADIYIPAGRSFFTMLSKNIFSIIENGVEIDYIFTQFGRLFQNTKKEFENLNKKISKKDLLFIENRYKELLKGTYAFEDDEDRIYINKDEFLPLNQISSGQQELLPAL